ncbi:MAG: elongation factor G [Anaerolineae bacterium]
MTKSYATEQIRNVVFLGHGSSGKTSLAEAMLFNTGAITRIGKVEEGNTVSDYSDEEIRRGISIRTSLVPCEWQGYKINVLDAPGYPDFAGEMLSALYVASTAILVLDAVAGVEVGTQLAWQQVVDNGKPRVAFLNKMNRENASYRRVVGELRAAFDGVFVPMQIPIREDGVFQGVVDLITLKAFTGEAGQVGEPPAEMADEIEEFRTELVEAAAEGEDALMEKYFEGEELTAGEIARGLKARLAAGEVVPVLCGSATANVGIRPLMDVIASTLPEPKTEVVATNPTTEQEETVGGGTSDSPLAAFVFKTVVDQYGKQSYFRVFSGTMTSDSRVFNSRSRSEERIGQMFVPRGREQLNVAQLVAGDIGAVVKLSETRTGDTLCDKGHPLVLPGVDYPTPVYSVAVTPRTQADTGKLGAGLNRLVEEDPTLIWRTEPNTKQTLLEGMGDTHIDVAVNHLKEAGVNVDVSIPKVPYLETITKTASAQYRHKKQTGGAGQFAEVHLRVEPLDRGAGFEYASEVFGGAISQSFLPSIEKGIKQVMEQGVIAGYNVVDVKAVVFDGREHPVDSKDIAFQIAGREVFKLAVKEARPVLLEPIMDMTVTVPEEYTGDIMSDLTTKRGRVSGMEQIRRNTVISAQAPLAEVQRYATDLRSMTQGRGVYTMKLSHYEQVPAQLTEQIIAKSREAENGS